MDMPEFQTSPTTEKIDDALSKAQGEFKPAMKEATNPFFKSKYADLASVIESCRAALTKHSIALSQWPVDQKDDRLHLVTRISHKGEWIMSRFSIPIGKQDPQGYKSALTYARRMALVAAFGIAEEDDDGNQATQNIQNAPRPGAGLAQKQSLSPSRDPRPTPPMPTAPPPKTRQAYSSGDEIPF